TITVFRDEQIVSNQKGRLHRPRWNIERLEQQGADNKGYEQGVEHHPAAFRKSALLALSFSGNAHWSLFFRHVSRFLDRFVAAFSHAPSILCAHKKPPPPPQRLHWLAEPKTLHVQQLMRQHSRVPGRQRPQILALLTACRPTSNQLKGQSCVFSYSAIAQ